MKKNVVALFLMAALSSGAEAQYLRCETFVGKIETILPGEDGKPIVLVSYDSHTFCEIFGNPVDYTLDSSSGLKSSLNNNNGSNQFSEHIADNAGDCKNAEPSTSWPVVI